MHHFSPDFAPKFQLLNIQDRHASPLIILTNYSKGPKMPENQFNWYLNLNLHRHLAAPQVFAAAAPEMLGAGPCAVASLK